MSRSIKLLAVAVVVLFALSSVRIGAFPVLLPKARASPAIIFSDPSDGVARSDTYVDSAGLSLYIGDDTQNFIDRAFVKFSLAGISGTLVSATLRIYVYISSEGGNLHNTSPLANPGLGDLTVRHIGDYGTLDAGDFNAPSIGNDPGVLISGLTTASIGYVSVDVRAAMQDDINNGRAFTTFMLKMVTDTNNDNNFNQWQFWASEQTGTSQDPLIDYTPAVIPEYPLGLPLLAIFMVIAYGLIRRRTSTKKF